MALDPGIYGKQPWEKELIEIALANRIASGDSLSSIEECKCYDKDGADVTAAIIVSSAIDGTDVNIWVQAGTDGEKYYITLKVNTAQGAKKEEDLTIEVDEVAHA